MFPSEWSSGASLGLVAGIFIAGVIAAFVVCRVIAKRKRYPRRCPCCGAPLERWAEKCKGCGGDVFVYPED